MQFLQLYVGRKKQYVVIFKTFILNLATPSKGTRGPKVPKRESVYTHGITLRRVDTIFVIIFKTAYINRCCNYFWKSYNLVCK